MRLVTETREDPKLGLAAEMLRCGCALRLKAWGVSMLPSVWPGDLLTIQSAVHDEVVPGDIVLVMRENRFVVHRLVRTQRDQDRLSWITRGDAMPHNDPPEVASELLGLVSGIRRAHRSFVPSRRVSPLQSVMARMLCRWDRLRNLTLRIHAARVQPGPTLAHQFFCVALGTGHEIPSASPFPTSHP